VNKSLKAVKNMLKEKSSQNELNHFVNEQGLINELLCMENIVGRWKWKSGGLVQKVLVPWEVQAINTLTDNFLWEKNDSFITVVTPGLYEVADRVI
jgi:hypothetical protein